MNVRWIFIFGCLGSTAFAQEGQDVSVPQATAFHAQHQMHGMPSGEETLPQDCERVSEDLIFTVKAGVEYASANSEKVFGYSQYDFRASPCARVTINFHNEDDVRHQWMLHGLPRYLYSQGMFHLEAEGGGRVSGSFIVPSDDATYLVHCDITTHTEKGMKAQLRVGNGTGNLWSVPGVSADFNRDISDPINASTLFASILLALSGVLLTLVVLKRINLKI